MKIVPTPSSITIPVFKLPPPEIVVTSNGVMKIYKRVILN